MKDKKELNEDIFVEGEGSNTSIVNVSDIVKSNNKLLDVESNYDKEIEIFKEKK